MIPAAKATGLIAMIAMNKVAGTRPHPPILFRIEIYCPFAPVKSPIWPQNDENGRFDLNFILEVKAIACIGKTNRGVCLSEIVDIAIVGSGPAGLSAAGRWDRPSAIRMR